jgi:signal peptidase I
VARIMNNYNQERNTSFEGESNIDKNDDKKGKIKKNRNFFFEWGVPLVVAIVIALLIKQFLIFKVYIPSPSMVPTINVGDHLFVTRIYNLDNLQRGDIIVFKSKEFNDTFIKRLIGLPGDNINIADGKVIVNGEVLEEDYVKNNDVNYINSFNVPEGKYFFLGDNRSNSKDSRYWNNPYISSEDIMAKARIRIYPFQNIGSLK